ncbi:MAG: oligosaccharide flippase family protein [Proteobacteria bacterium]|nr:oligosaccharide flippase family protein [Pseudomonadota bacterium]MBS0270506.1 oligosaccharide flippase family protein [Pseudomonadota bacterium]
MRGLRRALALTTAERYFSLVTNFITLSIVSRLLTPTEIGISVLGTAIASTVMALREFATPTYVIQCSNLSKDDVRTAVTVQMLASFAVGAVIFCSSWKLASIYQEPALGVYLRVVAISIAIESVAAPIAALLRRDMLFEKLVIIGVFNAAVSSVTTLTLIGLGFSYMSFAWAWLISAAASGVMSLFIWRDVSIFRPSLRSWSAVTGFGCVNGAHVTLARLYDAVPYLVLGRILPVDAVALYNRALTVCQLPDKVFFGGLSSALLSAFSAHARSGGDLKTSYLRSVQYVTAFQWPALAVVTVLAYPLVRIVLGAQWLEAVPIIQIIALASAFTFSNDLYYPVMAAAGAIGDIFKRALIVWPLSAAIVVSAASFGLYAAASAMFIAMPFQAAVSVYFIRRRIQFAWTDIFRILGHAVILAVSAIAGPLTVIAMDGGNFDLSAKDTTASIILSTIGWLLALRVTRHPLLDELLAIGRAVLKNVSKSHAIKECAQIPLNEEI